MQAVNSIDPRDYYNLAVGIGPDYDGDGYADGPGRRRGSPFGNPMMATLLGIFLVLVVWYFLKNRSLIPSNLSWGAQPSPVARTIPEPVPTASPLISLGPIGPTEPPLVQPEPTRAARSFEPAPRVAEPGPVAESPVPARQVTVPTQTLRVKNSEGIYLWDCLDAGCQRLSLLRQNTSVTLLGETTLANNEEWVRVRTANQVGWVSRYYLE